MEVEMGGGKFMPSICGDQKYKLNRVGPLQSQGDIYVPECCYRH